MAEYREFYDPLRLKRVGYGDPASLSLGGCSLHESQCVTLTAGNTSVRISKATVPAKIKCRKRDKKNFAKICIVPVCLKVRCKDQEECLKKDKSDGIFVELLQTVTSTFFGKRAYGLIFEIR